MPKPIEPPGGGKPDKNTTTDDVTKLTPKSFDSNGEYETSGTIAPGDKFLWKVRLSEGNELKVRVDPSDSLDVGLWIYDSKGNPLFSMINDEGVGAHEDFGPYGINKLSAGDYYIGIEPLHGTSGAFDLKIDIL